MRRRSPLHIRDSPTGKVVAVAGAGAGLHRAPMSRHSTFPDLGAAIDGRQEQHSSNPLWHPAPPLDLLPLYNSSAVADASSLGRFLVTAADTFESWSGREFPMMRSSAGICPFLRAAQLCDPDGFNLSACHLSMVVVCVSAATLPRNSHRRRWQFQEHGRRTSARTASGNAPAVYRRYRAAPPPPSQPNLNACRTTC